MVTFLIVLKKMLELVMQKTLLDLKSGKVFAI